MICSVFVCLMEMVYSSETSIVIVVFVFNDNEKNCHPFYAGGLFVIPLRNKGGIEAIRS